MPDFTFHVGVDQRNYFDHTITGAADIEAAKAELVSDLSEHSGLHIFDVTYPDASGEEVKEDIEEDVELANERYLRERIEKNARQPAINVVSSLRDTLHQLVDLVDQDRKGDIADVVSAADIFITSHLKGEKLTMNYVIVGRTIGDDEATTKIYNGTTRDAAVEAFTNEMKPDEVRDLAKYLNGEDFDGVWIDAVIESATPLMFD